MSDAILAAQKKLTGKVMGRPGISGTAVGMKGGSPCLKVYVDSSADRKSVPRKVDGFPVVIEESGSFRRL